MKVTSTIILLILAISTVSFAKCSIPFELSGSLIIVEAKVNNERGKFILDTGAPGLILNAKYFEGKPSEYMVVGTGGQIDAHEQEVTFFKWGCLKAINTKGLIIDLSYLEESIGVPLLGLIGYGMIFDTELVIDYTTKTIDVYKAPWLSRHKKQSPSMTVSFKLNYHFPVIHGSIKSQDIALAIDTGARSNLLCDIDKSLIFKAKKATYLVGVDQVLIPTNQVIIERTTIGDAHFAHLEYVLSHTANALAKQADFEGFIGGQFLKRWSKWAINYRKKEIYFWE